MNVGQVFFVIGMQMKSGNGSVSKALMHKKRGTVGRKFSESGWLDEL